MKLFYRYISPRTRVHRFLMAAFLLFLTPFTLFGGMLIITMLVSSPIDLLELKNGTFFLFATLPLCFFLLGARLFWVLWDGLSWKNWTWLLTYYSAVCVFWGMCVWWLADALHDELVNDVWKWPWVSLGCLTLPLIVTVIVRPSRDNVVFPDYFG